MAKPESDAENRGLAPEDREPEEALDLRFVAEMPVDDYPHRLIFESVPVGLFEVDVSGEITRINPHAVKLFTGSFSGQLQTSSLQELCASDDEWEAVIEELRRTGMVVGREVLMQREQGANFWGQLDVRLVIPPEGPVRVLGAVQDITGQKQREERLRQTAGHDPLTGLPHRAALNDRLKREIAQMRRDLSHRFAVGFVDLDDFKKINDDYGHIVGDQVLLAVAHRLKRGLRPEDTVYRYGGDEFAVVLQGVEDAEAAEIVGGRMLDVLQSPFQIQQGVVRLSASVGIRVCSSHEEEPDQLLHAADRAMYVAKRRGGGDAVEVVTE